MGEANNEIYVRQITAASPDYLRALHLALGTEWLTSSTPAKQVSGLLAHVDRGTASLDLLFGAYAVGRLVSACVAVQSPGAAALVFPPPAGPGEVNARGALAALEAVKDTAWSRSIRLLQVLTDPEEEQLASTLQEAGFRRLTRLLYLIRPGDLPGTCSGAAGELTWVAYTPARMRLFCEALEATYVQSLDCPELNGVRTTGDVLAGHRATGIFDPSLWWVAKRDNAAAGVLLLNGVVGESALEIVYMGVAQASRGTRVADALLDRATRAARRLGAKTLALAVDERNIRARRMYARWDFVQTMTRDAWIASPAHT